MVKRTRTGGWMAFHRTDRMPEVCLPQDCLPIGRKTAGPSRGSQMRMKWAQSVHTVFTSKVYRSELCLLRTEKKKSMLIGISRVFVCLFLQKVFFSFCFRNTYWTPTLSQALRQAVRDTEIYKIVPLLPTNSQCSGQDYWENSTTLKVLSAMIVLFSRTLGEQWDTPAFSVGFRCFSYVSKTKNDHRRKCHLIWFFKGNWPIEESWGKGI